MLRNEGISETNEIVRFWHKPSLRVYFCSFKYSLKCFIKPECSQSFKKWVEKLAKSFKQAVKINVNERLSILLGVMFKIVYRFLTIFTRGCAETYEQAFKNFIFEWYEEVLTTKMRFLRLVSFYVWFNLILIKPLKKK